jgi:peptide/nickel transport system substrate-binding protein
VIVIPEDPPSFNPNMADTGYDALVMELVMLGLTDIDESGNIFPELAAELPSVDNGGVVINEDEGTMNVTWTLRDDVQWEDGTPVTANDVVFTYEAVTNPDTGLWIQGIDYVDGVEKIDDHTVVIHYNTIYPGYLTQFGGEQMVIWPAHYCDAKQGFASWDCAQQPLSNGPFMLKEWIKSDHLTFVKNPNYFETGKPQIDTVIVRIVPDEAVRQTMLSNGDADLDMWSSAAMINNLKDDPAVKISHSPTSRWMMRMWFNLAARGTVDPIETPHPILSDVRVRQAIRSAIDVETITTSIFYETAQPQWTEFFRPPYVCDVPRPAFDQAAASALLEEAGWKDTDGDGTRECHGCTTGAEEGYMMEMELATYGEYGEPLLLAQQLIAEQLGKVGIKLNLTVIEGSLMWGAYEEGGTEQTGNYDIDLWDDGYSGSDPTDFLWEIYHTDASEPNMGVNTARYNNLEIDELIDGAYSGDEDLRNESFCRMAEILNDDLPVIPLFTISDEAIHSARLEGVISNANDLPTWNAAEWIIK